MTAPRAIFHLISTLEAGGAQTLLLATLPRLDPERFRPIIGYLWGHAEALEGPGLRVVDFSRGGAFDPRALWRVAAFLRRERIEIVHTHLVHAGILGRLAARMAGVPRIVTTRHYADDPKERSLAYRLENRLTRSSDRVIAVSESVRRYLIDRGIAPADRTVLLTNGIDLDRFDPKVVAKTPPPTGIIGSAGRLRPQKGFDVLLCAFAQLHGSHPNTILEIAGEGPERGVLVALARELGIASSVRFLGAVPPEAMPRQYRRWDLFLLASRYEAFGLVALEAMAMEVPVVATRAGGLTELLEDDVTGLLVYREDPSGLARAALRLLDHPDEAAAIAARARAWVLAHGSVRTSVEGLQEIYDGLR